MYEGEKIVNLVVQVRKPGRNWVEFCHAGAEGQELHARRVFRDLIRGKAVHGFTVEYQLVRREAVITDTVIATE